MMMFHDGKTPWVANIVAQLIQDFSTEIDTITFNKSGSNMIKIVKGYRKDYYNWNIPEKDNNRQDTWTDHDK
jgi:hypothetical protein